MEEAPALRQSNARGDSTANPVRAWAYLAAPTVSPSSSYSLCCGLGTDGLFLARFANPRRLSAGGAVVHCKLDSSILETCADKLWLGISAGFTVLGKAHGRDKERLWAYRVRVSREEETRTTSSSGLQFTDQYPLAETFGIRLSGTSSVTTPLHRCDSKRAQPNAMILPFGYQACTTRQAPTPVASTSARNLFPAQGSAVPSLRYESEQHPYLGNDRTCDFVRESRLEWRCRLAIFELAIQWQLADLLEHACCRSGHPL